MHARSRICSDLPVVLCRSGKRSLLPLPALPSSLELSSEQDASAAARLRLLPPVEEPKLRRKLGTGVLGTSGGFAHLAQWNPSFCQSIHVWELASRMGAPLLRRLPSEVCAADSLEVQRRAGCCCCCWRWCWYCCWGPHRLHQSHWRVHCLSQPCRLRRNVRLWPCRHCHQCRSTCSQVHPDSYSRQCSARPPPIAQPHHAQYPSAAFRASPPCSRSTVTRRRGGRGRPS
mmetsp:Transcript_84248/g.247114  ORF Transcript_84248/g.247114 Transcript_84248/m.247114 type:complete len:230 (-) Transcript_84248:1033-1722(-)